MAAWGAFWGSSTLRAKRHDDGGCAIVGIAENRVDKMKPSRRDFQRMATLGLSGLAIQIQGWTERANAQIRLGSRSIVNGVQFGIQPFCYHDLNMTIANRRSWCVESRRTAWEWSNCTQCGASPALPQAPWIARLRQLAGKEGSLRRQPLLFFWERNDGDFVGLDRYALLDFAISLRLDTNLIDAWV